MDDEKVAALLDQLLSNIDPSYDKSEGYLIHDMLKSVAIVVSDLQGDLEGVQRLLDVDNLTGALLEAFVKQRKGIVRTPATYGSGILQVTGNGTANVGDLFETPSGVQFAADEVKTITGSGTLRVKSILSGPVGNVPADQITQMPVTLPGITAVTNPQPTDGGYAAETDDSLRERYYIAVRTPPTSANIYHYLQWAKEVSGVGGAKVFPVERGDNTVEVIIIDQEKQPAAQTLVDQVQEHIDPGSTGLGNGEAPIGAKCYVLSADPLILNISVSVSSAGGYTIDEVRENIEDSITEYLKSIAFQLNYVSYARIGQAILDSVGVEDYAGLLVNGAIDNPQVGPKQVAVLGAVSLV
ncbi:baseplate J/gp47 family protein [Paenibacillus lautus]|uniref:Baseplate J/gp47 family protein n=1 Tax=Paenibacillus lautus TaxID=1401 RepID=A0A385TGU7_PAELA|nr:baseplate J/gp47 family protein [Paenibacillus lautus]AYB41802.1 baseplate J/gp47 family protein [Paenibacillus lautus]